jgi:serine/threonine protein phosphatase PrpC
MTAVGVVATPEVKTFPVPYERFFVLVASDGIWGVLSNERAANIVGDVLNVLGSSGAQAAAEALEREARSLWRADLPVEVIVDDISCVVAASDFGRGQFRVP